MIICPENGKWYQVCQGDNQAVQQFFNYQDSDNVLFFMFDGHINNETPFIFAMTHVPFTVWMFKIYCFHLISPWFV
jgi:hypothetical protein